VVVREKNGGAAACRNTGWTLASGDWIQFLDQDDLLAPHKIERQAHVASQSEDVVAVVYSNWQHLLLEHGTWQPSGPVNAPVVDANPVVKILEQNDFGYVGPTLIRKSFLERIGGFDEKPNLGEDINLMLRLAMAGGQFREARSEEVAFLYRQSPNSLWRTYIKSIEPMRNLVHGFHDVEEFLRGQSPDRSLSESARYALANRYSRFIDFYFEHDKKSYDLIIGWLKGLDFDGPINLNPLVQMLSQVIGYTEAIRLRSTWRTYSRDRRASSNLPAHTQSKTRSVGALPAASVVCGHKGIESGLACLLLVVQGQLGDANASDFLLASATGGLTAFSLLGIAWTRFAHHLTNRWIIAALVGVSACFADAVMHGSVYSGDFAKAALTGLCTAALSLGISHTPFGRRMDHFAEALR
jgi:glycosyltransferase involved in cell wall biosynthesis